MTRSTVRLEDDVIRELMKRAERDKVSLTRALNDAVREGLRSEGTRRRRVYREKTFALGQPALDLRKALAVAAALEDEEIARKALLRK